MLLRSISFRTSSFMLVCPREGSFAVPAKKVWQQHMALSSSITRLCWREVRHCFTLNLHCSLCRTICSFYTANRYALLDTRSHIYWRYIIHTRANHWSPISRRSASIYLVTGQLGVLTHHPRLSTILLNTCFRILK